MKRFYDVAQAAAVESGWQVQLDGRGLKTIKGHQQVVPSRVLAEALAKEWAEQSEEIDTSRFIMRDLADYAIDLVQPDPSRTIATLVGFAETDTLCYRADPDEPLFSHQQQKWEPLLAQIETRENVNFTRVSGIMHKPQPPETIMRLRQRLGELDHFTLAALHTLSSLAASLCIGLVAIEGEEMEPVALWRAASLEEEWQADLWGRDPQAEERRAKRQNEFLGAFRFLELLRS